MKKGFEMRLEAALADHTLSQDAVLILLRDCGESARTAELEDEFKRNRAMHAAARGHGAFEDGAARAYEDGAARAFMAATPTAGVNALDLGIFAELSAPTQEQLVKGMAVVASSTSDKTTRRALATAAVTSATTIGGGVGPSAGLQQELGKMPVVARAVYLGCGRSRKPDNTPLQTCSGCMVARFCGKECQRKTWQTHKHHCAAWKARASVRAQQV
jgi:hypothetical protein